MKETQKIILLAVVAPLLLVLLAGGGYWWFQSNSEAAQAAAAAEQAALPKFVYLQMPDLKVPAAQGGVGQVDLKIALEVYYAEKDAVTQAEPRLMAAFESNLYTYLGEGNKIVPGKVENLDKVKARLVAVAMQELGPGKVNDILIQPVSRLWENSAPKKKDKDKEEE